MAKEQPVDSRSELAVGWLPLLIAMICIGVGISALPFYTSGIMMLALEEAFGWSRTAIAAGNLAISLGLAVGASVIGLFVERFGARRVALLSMMLLGLGFLALSQLAGDYRAFLSIMFLTGLFGAGSSAVVFTRVVVAWFERQRGLALGAALSGAGFAAIWGPVAIQEAIHLGEWRGGYWLLAGAAALTLPLIAVLREQPNGSTEVSPTLRPKEAKAAFRSVNFAILTFSALLMVVAIAGPMVHLVPMLADRGVPAAQAALVASIIGAAVIVARLVVGASLDAFHPPIVAGVALAIAALGAFLLGLGSTQTALIGAICVGFALGAEVDILAFLVAHYFPKRLYGQLFGVLYAVSILAAGAAPVIFSGIRDFTGGYNLALVSSMLELAVAAILLQALRVPAEGYCQGNRA
jgi:MFS family permease